MPFVPAARKSDQSEISALVPHSFASLPMGKGGGVLAVKVIEWPLCFLLIDSEDVDDIFSSCPCGHVCEAVMEPG